MMCMREDFGGDKFDDMISSRFYFAFCASNVNM